MDNNSLLDIILESARQFTNKYKVSGPNGLKEETVQTTEDLTFASLAKKINSFIGKHEEQQQHKFVEPFAFERGYHAGEAGTTVNKNTLWNFNELTSDRQREAFCAGFAAAQPIKKLKESAGCSACDQKKKLQLRKKQSTKGVK